MRFVTKKCEGQRQLGDREVGGGLTGIKLDLATVVMAFDELADPNVIAWIGQLRTRGPTPAGPKITIELVG